ncbi:metallophosphoesterase family protein [Brevibacterium album]|uniref:metallophosphoesterase family protein n=1 Tax=Brevibacterium album TaxID=417948 RepID=UPI000404BB2E|nr:metallophosphoesterase [Brevibacterium album]
MLTTRAPEPSGRFRGEPGGTRARRTRLRAWAGWALALLLCLLIALPAAVLTARAESTFGPHEAVYSVTTDGALEADFGPLGSLVLPAGELLPGRFGVHIAVGEIPAEYGMEDSTVDALGGDAAAYAALFADPEAQARAVVRALLEDVALRTVLLGGGLFLAGGAVRILFGGPRRHGLLAVVPSASDGPLTARLVQVPPHVRLGASAVVAAMVLGAAAVPVDRDRIVRADPVFEGTPLAGAQVTGRLSGVVDEAAQTVADMLADTDEFYSGVRAELAAAWPERPLSPRWRSGESGLLGPGPGEVPALAPEAGEADPPAPDGAGADGADPAPEEQADTGPGSGAGAGEADPGEPDGAGGAAAGPAGAGGARADDRDAADEPAAEAEPEDIATLVWTSDIHCQTGMSRTIGDLIAWTGADLHVDGGDITMTGTEAENVCVDSLARAVPEGVPTVFVKGNHDSEDTAQRAREVGWTVLEGEPVEAAGLTLLGDADPRRTVFPSGDVLERGETGEEFAARVAREACAADEDLLVIHDARHAEPALSQGCSDYAFHGHWHRRVEPEQWGRGVRTVGSTTGGALADALTPGPLKMQAEMSVIRVDRRTGAPIDVQYVTVGMDQSVEFSEWLPFPQPRPLVEVEPEQGGAE